MDNEDDSIVGVETLEGNKKRSSDADNRETESKNKSEDIVSIDSQIDKNNGKQKGLRLCNF